MNYELSIQILERELDHLKAMQRSNANRLDAHAQSFEVIEARFDRIEKNMEVFSEGMKAVQSGQLATDMHLRVLSGDLKDLTKTLQEFIQVLAKSHGNGKT